jgi:beta-N-acetylhexosaminidase
LVRGFRRAASDAGLRTGWGDTVALIGYGGTAASADVVAATDTPYVLADSRARVKIATYGSTPGAMRSLVDVLLGRWEAPGRLPVEVPGVARQGC